MAQTSLSFILYDKGAYFGTEGFSLLAERIWKLCFIKVVIARNIPVARMFLIFNVDGTRGWTLGHAGSGQDNSW